MDGVSNNYTQTSVTPSNFGGISDSEHLTQSIAPRVKASGVELGILSMPGETIRSSQLIGLVERLEAILQSLIENAMLEISSLLSGALSELFPAQVNQGTPVTSGGVVPPSTTGTVPGTPSGQSPAGGRLSFTEKMGEILEYKQGKKVNESELQAAAVQFQLYQKNPMIETAFKKAFDEAVSYGTKNEAAVKIALSKMVDQGHLRRDEAEWVNGLTFRAVQLDERPASLSSNQQGQMELDPALQMVEATLAGIQAGAIKAEPRVLQG